jgi:hypothetical protein
MQNEWCVINDTIYTDAGFSFENISSLVLTLKEAKEMKRHHH